MSPIEEHLVRGLENELKSRGVLHPAIAVLSAEAENWRFRITATGREFEIGFNHLEQLWVREVTIGRERHLVSNDEPRISLSDVARRRALDRVAQALATPAFPPRDPPVI